MIFSYGFQGEFFGSNFFKKNLLKFENGHSEKVKGVVYLEEMNLIYSFGDDGKIVRWRVENDD
jgi:hypothetical protein